MADAYGTLSIPFSAAILSEVVLLEASLAVVTMLADSRTKPGTKKSRSTAKQTSTSASTLIAVVSAMHSQSHMVPILAAEERVVCHFFLPYVTVEAFHLPKTLSLYHYRLAFNLLHGDIPGQNSPSNAF